MLLDSWSPRHPPPGKLKGRAPVDRSIWRLKRKMSLFGDPRLLNEPRLRTMMDRYDLDLLFICGVVNSKYLSGFFHNGGDHDGMVGARPFAVMYFRDEEKAAAMLVPAVDLHLAIDSSWIRDVRGYIAAEKSTD